MSEAIYAFWTDLADHHDRLTMVVMTEFGRRLKENDNRGTDHGRGGLMMVLSANFRTPWIHGHWPGLDPDSLFERVDLLVTTDYRTVLTEILDARRADRNFRNVFPGFRYSGPLGLFLPTNAVSRDTWARYE